MINRSEVERKILLIRESKIRKARNNFWEFCKLLAPDFYTDGIAHLKLICDTLQNLYECRLIDKNGEPYKRLMINMPP